MAGDYTGWWPASEGRNVLTGLMARAPRVVPDQGEGWTVHHALFVRAGFTEATRALAAEEGVLLVDLDELGRCLGTHRSRGLPF